jgi:hypothetical protein
MGCALNVFHSIQCYDRFVMVLPLVTDDRRSCLLRAEAIF